MRFIARPRRKFLRPACARRRAFFFYSGAFAPWLQPCPLLPTFSAEFFTRFFFALPPSFRIFFPRLFLPLSALHLISLSFPAFSKKAKSRGPEKIQAAALILKK